MKKFFLGLVATIIVSFWGNAQDKFINDEMTSYRSNDYTVKPKNGWYYAGVDASTGWGCAQGGSVFGPLGTAAGGILGGICGSTWAYYWENKSQPLPLVIKHPKDSFVDSYINEFERCGYLHNKFVETFLNNNKTTFNSSAEFIDVVYNPLCDMISKEYKISVSDLKKSFPKEFLQKMLDRCTKISTLTNDETIINEMTLLVQEESNNSNLSKSYFQTMRLLYSSCNDEYFDIVSFIKNEIYKVDSSKEYNDNEKKIIKNSLNLLKYSYSLWNVN